MPATEHTASNVLKQKSENAYCDYIDQMKRPECLGWQEKVRVGKFGGAELSAHTYGGTLLGKHRAYADAAKDYESLLAQVRVLREALKKAERCLTELYPSRVFTGAHEEEYYAVNRVLNVARAALAQCEVRK